MRHKFFKVQNVFALILALCMFFCLSAGSLSAFAAGADDVLGTRSYSLINPYANVDWDNWKAYKSMTHVHSKMSDGDIEFNDMIENYYAKDYDCISMTDHGVINYGWTKDKDRKVIYWYQGTKGDPLSSTRNREITTGVGRNGKAMIDIPYGIELNGMSVTKTHINGFFADAGDGDMEMDAAGVKGCITAVKKNHNAGGITHINHVGEFMSANDCDTIDQAKEIYDSSFISDFANMFLSYSSCVGMELVNTADSRTKWDRYLYDELLKILAPKGRNLFGFCEDDSHDEGDIDRNAQYYWMPSNTVANVRTAMETGAFFASSKSSKGVYYPELTSVDKAMPYPAVSRVSYDMPHSQLSFEVSNTTRAYMVAEGRLVANISLAGEDNETVTFDLNNYESTIKSYVRVYFTGPGGITYAQPFLITGTTPHANPNPQAVFNVNMSGFNLVLKNSEGQELSAATVSDYSVIYNIAPGEYTYEVTKSGFNTVTGSFTVTGDDIINGTNKTLSITLQPSIDLIVDTEKVSVSPNGKYLYNITDFDSYFEDGIASSSHSAYGTVTYTPTENGYGTGTVVSLVHDGFTYETRTVVVYGDLDGDGITDGTDYNLAYFIVTGDDYGMLNDFMYEAIDVDADGERDLLDCEKILKAGLFEYTVDQSTERISVPLD